jgi:hypothetical protein
VSASASLLPDAEKSRPGFKITGGKGFHVTFENGWTVSVQFGGGNYSENYDAEIYPVPEPLPKSGTAEIAAWGPDGSWHNFGDDTVAGYKTPAEVLAFLDWVAAK